MPAVRFLVDLKGGLSSGVNGVFEPWEGVGEWCCEQEEVVDEVRLLDPAVLL